MNANSPSNTPGSTYTHSFTNMHINTNSLTNLHMSTNSFTNLHINTIHFRFPLI